MLEIYAVPIPCHCNLAGLCSHWEKILEARLGQTQISHIQKFSRKTAFQARLAVVLARIMAIKATPDDLLLTRTRAGKPVFFPNRYAVSFSYSGSASFCALADEVDCLIAIDAEDISKANCEALAGFFSRFNRVLPYRPENIIKMWTIFESAIKICGIASLSPLAARVSKINCASLEKGEGNIFFDGHNILWRSWTSKNHIATLAATSRFQNIRIKWLEIDELYPAAIRNRLEDTNYN